MIRNCDNTSTSVHQHLNEFPNERAIKNKTCFLKMVAHVPNRLGIPATNYAGESQWTQLSLLEGNQPAIPEVGGAHISPTDVLNHITVPKIQRTSPHVIRRYSTTSYQQTHDDLKAQEPEWHRACC